MNLTLYLRGGLMVSVPLSGSSGPGSSLALFTVNFSHLHHNIRHNLAFIGGNFGYLAVLTRICLAQKLDYIVMQMRKTNRERGYCVAFLGKTLYYLLPPPRVHKWVHFCTGKFYAGGNPVMD